MRSKQGPSSKQLKPASFERIPDLSLEETGKEQINQALRVYLNLAR